MLIELDALASEQISHFRMFGLLQLKSRLDEALIAAIDKEYEHVLGPGPWRLPCQEAGRPPAWIARCMDANTPTIVAFATHDHVLRLAEDLLGRPAICVLAAGYLRSEDTRWHSDNPVLAYEGLKVYINLDAVDGTSGALRVVPCSHREPIRSGLIPAEGARAEDAFGVRADQIPAVALNSRPGDISLFDLRVWHAVCASPTRRRVIELSYYADPTSPSEFIRQMQANQQSAMWAGVEYFPPFWQQARGRRHQHGVRRLAKLDLLHTVARVASPSKEKPAK